MSAADWRPGIIVIFHMWRYGLLIGGNPVYIINIYIFRYFVRHGLTSSRNTWISFAMLMRLARAKQLSMAVTVQMIWLFTCVQ